MYPNAESLVKSLRETIELQRAMSKPILEKLSPPPGPYSLFHHHGHMLERLEDVAMIIERIGRARMRVTILNTREAKLEPKGGFKVGVPFPEKVQVIARENHKLIQHMRMDYESLYIFANMALDQWAYTIAYTLGLENPEKYDFNYLVSMMQAHIPPERLREFASQHLRDALWLYYQLRFYRNNFIEHVRRPWQRGSSMATYGDDFNFFIPSPPGWVSKQREEELMQSISHLTAEYIKNVPEGHWQRRPRAVLETTFKRIEEIPNQADRDKVWNVWKELGGSVVSFDILGRRLDGFVRSSSSTIASSIENNPDLINLGPPLVD